MVIQHDIANAPYEGLAALQAYLARADGVMTDLEGALAGPGSGPAVRDTIFDHSAGPEVLASLSALSVNLVALSNNHAFDLGSGGIKSTIAALDARHMQHAGAGATLAQAAAPTYLATPHGRIGMVAMAAGKIAEGGRATDTQPGVFEIRRNADGSFNTDDQARAFAAIKQATAQADLVIAYHHNHWWDDDQTRPPPWLRQFSRQLIDAGAHAFVGHGAPNMQGIELYRDRPVIYNPGSLVFQTRTEVGRYPPEAWMSFIADLTFDRDGWRGFEIVPVQLNEVSADPSRPIETRGRPHLATGAEAARILAVLKSRSEALGTSLEISDGRARIALRRSA
jgi:poly-gamma-glutamate synthesis protein (capsule biosynthesis protein)